MHDTTPRKRKIEQAYHDASEEEQGSPGIEGDAIDWQEEEQVIGPTPQKNGRLLGLFDVLSPEKPSSANPPAASAQPEHWTLAVPAQKQTKRPTKSPLKTPSFLRRQVRTIEDSGTESTPRLLFPALPRRGLSHLISELREIEDNYEDEGMDVLREMEANFPAIPKDSEDGPAGQANKNQDGSEEVVENEKVKWKKKGLKRSHRRVIMRPAGKKKTTEAGAKTDVQANEVSDDSDEYINSDDEAADAQASLGRPMATTVMPASRTSGTTTIANSKDPQKGAKAHKAGGISHNFKSLKLRNSGSKGGSRFGRGRFGGRR